jgi:hypothetical protein
LQKAIYETLSKRETPYKADSVIVIERLVDNNEIINRWDNFCNKILKYKLDFGKVVELIVMFINPPFQAMVNEDEFWGKWNYEKRQYEK